MLENFFLYGPLPAESERGVYLPWLVFASYVTAVFGSYAGLTLATKIFMATTLRDKRTFHWMGACGLGIGIWSMHFIGMLAYKMSMLITYDPWLTGFSLLIAIAVAYAALWVTQVNHFSVKRLLMSAVILGLGICIMHYTGMEAMQMRAKTFYTPTLFSLSVIIAIVASGAALWIIVVLGRHSGRYKTLWMIIASLVMGVAICGMHYTGVEATVFVPLTNCLSDANQNFLPLAVSLIVSTIVLLFILTFAVSRRLFLVASCAVLFMLPLVAIVYEAIHSLNTDIRTAAREQEGLYYHAQLMNVLEKLQQVRGITLAAREGEESLSQTLEAGKTELLNAISNADEAEKVYRGARSTDQNWTAVKQDALKLSQAETAQPADIEFNNYTTVINSLLTYMIDVTDDSGLINDPVLETSYLADVLGRVIPNSVEAIGGMRALSIGLLAAHKSQAPWSDKDIRGLHLYYDTLANNDLNLTSDLTRANHADRADHFIDQYDEHISPQQDAFREILSQFIFAHKSPLPAADIRHLGNNIILAHDTLYTNIHERFYTALEERRASYTLNRTLVLSSSVVAFIGFLTIFVFLYRSLARTEKDQQKILGAQHDLAQRLLEKEHMEDRMRSYTERLEESRYETIESNTRLEQEGAKIKTIMDNVSEGIVTIDTHGFIQTFNKAAENVFGYNADEVIGKSVDFLMSTEGGSFLQNYIKRSADHKVILNQEGTGRHKDGILFPMILSFSKVDIGDFPLFIGVFRDVTQQKDREKELNVAKERAEAANKTKSEFLANMSHELRTPLNSILGMLRLLKEAQLGEEEHNLADIAFRSSTHLLEIVNDVLDLSKIEAGEMRLERIGMDIEYVIDGVLLTLNQSAREKHIALTRTETLDRLPYVLGDPTRLALIMTNLVGNAIKYTDEGSVSIRSSFETRDDGNILFHCAVTDTGIGIPSDKLTSVFDKFIQADTSTTRKYGGTGLGLAITKQLVEMMGGEIGIRSEVGVGSTFWITLPFEITDKLDREKRIKKMKARAGTLPPDQTRVLIAEDQLMNQILMTKVMKRFNISTFKIVKNGVEAVHEFLAAPWDIILMDCHMPEMNGYDATRAIRKHERATGKHVPIVALTANAMMGDKEECFRSGMSDYASKPINLDELQEILGQWIAFAKPIG